MSFASFASAAVHDVEHFFSFFSKTSNSQKVLAIAGTLVPTIEAGLAFSGDPEAAAEVQNVFSQTQTCLGTFTALVQSSGTTPSALSVLGAIKSNLTGVLQVAHVKNSAKVAEITALVNAAVSEIDAISNYFPAAAPQAPAAQAVALKPQVAV